MKTTINLDNDLVGRAMEMTGIREKTALIHAGLRALLEKAAQERLSKLKGTRPEWTLPHRRRVS